MLKPYWGKSCFFFFTTTSFYHWAVLWCYFSRFKSHYTNLSRADLCTFYRAHIHNWNDTWITAFTVRQMFFQLERKTLPLKGSSLGSRYWISASHFLFFLKAWASLIFIPLWRLPSTLAQHSFALCDATVTFIFNVQTMSLTFNSCWFQHLLTRPLNLPERRYIQGLLHPRLARACLSCVRDVLHLVSERFCCNVLWPFPLSQAGWKALWDGGGIIELFHSSLRSLAFPLLAVYLKAIIFPNS